MSHLVTAVYADDQHLQYMRLIVCRRFFIFLCLCPNPFKHLRMLMTDSEIYVDFIVAGRIHDMNTMLEAVCQTLMIM